jgi:hypothetical protein
VDDKRDSRLMYVKGGAAVRVNPRRPAAKAIGVGLFGSPADISFRFDEHPQIEFMGPPANDSHEWHFALFEPFHDVRLGIAICGVARPHLFLSQYEGDERTLPPIRGSPKMIFSKQT